MLETTSSSREAILESDGWNSHVTHQTPLEFPIDSDGWNSHHWGEFHSDGVALEFPFHPSES
jgi:hypothetical protein